MPGDESQKRPPEGTVRRLRGPVSKHFDVEMFQKGWWMLILIIGSIGVLFTIGVVLMAKQ
jgi:hypothetical protein